MDVPFNLGYTTKVYNLLSNLSFLGRSMKITHFTDYSLRLLMYLARNPGRIVTVREISEFHEISAEHLKKVVRGLSDLGHLRTVRGKNGGLRLAREPSEINIGQLVRDEENLSVLPCYDERGGCTLTDCGLRSVVDTALAAFFAVLDAKTLADII
jgi:Rrf2 family transcriptional regulator, nitric oxide-sensitive transcriptional repressor